MALVEELLAEIADPKLRAALEREVRELKERKDFGLVFERHLPESVLLPPSVGLEPGTEVRLRQQPNDPRRLYVIRLSEGRATIRENGAGEEQEVAVDDLLVVRRFDQAFYPTLRATDYVKRAEGRDPHLVIESENYDALQLLRYTHAGKIDCIYIDPPYNTGARDWKYNNDYVDQNDRWRHSKWLSFMEKRLQLAKDLLRPDGVLIVTIGEHEVSHLGVLLEQVFPEYLRYLITIVHNPKGTAKVNFGRVAEYAFYVVPDTGEDVIAFLPPPEDDPEAELAADAEEEGAREWTREISPVGAVRLPGAARAQLGLDAGEPVDIALTEEGILELAPAAGEESEEEIAEDDALEEEPQVEIQVLHLRRRGARSSFRHQRPRSFYAIKVDVKRRQVVGVGPPLEPDDSYEPNKLEGDLIWLYPIDDDGQERVWRYGRETMQELIRRGEIKVGKEWKDKPQKFTLNHHKPREGERVQRLRTVWWRKDHDAGTHGTTLISRMLDRPSPFPYPKSLYAVRDALEAVVRDRPDALILDFFAGSGTTLHATWLLNQADGGRRRCILVTNNEVDGDTADELAARGHYPGDPEYESRGVFQSATKPRILCALTGRNPAGDPYPRTRSYRYTDGRYWAEGFAENVLFAALEYLNPDELELGRDLERLGAVMWLGAGARGSMPELKQEWDYELYPDGGFAVLWNDAAFPRLVEALADQEIPRVYIATDYSDSYATMTAQLPGRKVEMVPRAYLEWFARQRGASA